MYSSRLQTRVKSEMRVVLDISNNIRSLSRKKQTFGITIGGCISIKILLQVTTSNELYSYIWDILT